MPINHGEFRKRVTEIEQSKYRGGFGSMFDFAQKRMEFEEQKLRELIALADQTNLSQAKRRQVSWKRMLEKLQSKRAATEQLKKESPGSVLPKYVSARSR